MERDPTDKRVDDMADRVGRFEGRFERFEDKVEKRFDKVDARFDKMDARFDKIEGEFKTVASKQDLAAINARLDRWGRVMAGGVVSIAGAVVYKVLGL